MSRRPTQHYQCFDGLAPISDIKKCIKHGHSVLIIMRGPPGCGKTKLAETLRDYRTIDAEDSRGPVVLSTDRYFMTPAGRYAFDHTRLDEFHKKNRDDATRAIENNQSPVIIDNTNMQLAHMKQYILMAVKWCYEIYVLEPDTPWRRDARQLAKRNVHGVDERAIEAMLAGYEPITRFADLLKPAQFTISRVLMSDDDSDGGGDVVQPMQPLSLSALAAVSSSGGPTVAASTLVTSLPPGLFSPGMVLQPGPPVLPAPSQSSPIISMSHEPLVTVHQRDVSCQATPAIGLLAEMGPQGQETAAISALCFATHGDVRVAARRRVAAAATRGVGPPTADAETDAACPAPSPIEVIAAAFPDVPRDDVEHYAALMPVTECAALLLAMGYELDAEAPAPWHAGGEDADRNSRARKGRHKELVVGAFKQETTGTQTTPKKQTSIRTQKLQLRSGRGEGCGGGRVTATTDDHSSSASLSNDGYNGIEEKLEPLAAAFTDDEELIALDVKQPIKNILELFFGHNSRQPDVHMPMWLLRLLHRCARGDRLTRGAVYHEQFPAIDLCALPNAEAATQQQLRNDAEIARALHAEETQRRDRERSSSPTDSFTPDQIKGVRLLRGKYPTADRDQVAALYKEMGFNMTATMQLLFEHYGEAAPGPAHTLPASVLAPPAPQLYATPTSSSAARASSSTTTGGGGFAAVAALPTLAANGRITDVGRMAAANGAPMTQEEVRLQFIALHERRQEKQQRLDEALRKAQSVKDHHTRGYYGQEIRRAKEERIRVEDEIAALAEWWNTNLNSDLLDLHWMLADQAMQLLRERIETIKRSRGGCRRLTVITGSGNNSIGGKAEIKQRVLAMCTTQGYKHHHNNSGSIIIHL